MMLSIDHVTGFIGGFFVAGALAWRIRSTALRLHRRLVAAQNLSELARQLTYLERGQKQISIAQVREVLAVLGLHLRLLPQPQAEAVLDAIRERAGQARKEQGTADASGE